jgi:hypothetical protein
MAVISLGWLWKCQGKGYNSTDRKGNKASSGAYSSQENEQTLVMVEESGALQKS